VTGIPLVLLAASIIVSGISSYMMMSVIKAARPDDPRFSWWRHPSPIAFCKTYLRLHPDSWLPQIFVGSTISAILIVLVVAVRG
jgi:hypothetical protein